MTTKFEGVTVETKANIYFDGKVQSRTIFLPGGERKTLGVIMAGEYEFGTADREEMQMTHGEVKVLLPGKTEWETYKAGETFHIPAKSSFKVECKEPFEYICSYFKN